MNLEQAQVRLSIKRNIFQKIRYHDIAPWNHLNSGVLFQTIEEMLNGARPGLLDIFEDEGYKDKVIRLYFEVE